MNLIYILSIDTSYMMSISGQYLLAAVYLFALSAISWIIKCDSNYLFVLPFPEQLDVNLFQFCPLR